MEKPFHGKVNIAERHLEAFVKLSGKFCLLIIHVPNISSLGIKYPGLSEHDSFLRVDMLNSTFLWC